MERENLSLELERIFSKKQELPLLLRGTFTRHLLSIFNVGVLLPLNPESGFLFYAIPETFDRLGIEIHKEENKTRGYDFIYNLCKTWARVHTNFYEVEKLGGMTLEQLPAFYAMREKMIGSIIGFNQRALELGIFPEYSGKGHIVTTSEPVELRCEHGIPLEYIAFVEPIGELDKKMLLEAYEKTIGHKLTSEQLAKTSLE